MTETVPPDDVVRLQSEVDDLRAKLDRRAIRADRARRSGLVFLLGFGCLLVALSVIAIFVRVTVLNSDRYVKTMAPIAASPAVQQAVADKLDTAITSRVDFDSLLREALPDRADPLAPALAGGLQQAIRSRLDDFVASERFQTLWNDANRRVHDRVVELISTGRSKRLVLQGDTVYLDLGAVVDRVRQTLQERGLERLAAAIPPSVDGRITLLQSDGLVKARRAVHVLEALTIVLPILALLCLAGHVWLSKPRRRGLLRVGLGLLLTAFLMLALLGIGKTAYLDAINQNVLPRQAAADIFDALIGLLRTSVRVVAIAAILLAIVALLIGRVGPLARRSATAARALATDERLGWVAEHRATLQWSTVGLGVVVLLFWSAPGAGVVLLVAALVVATVLVIGALAGASPGRQAGTGVTS